ncbi:F-box-like protein, partial [Rhizoctonia solani AG-3 Rhs1AP]
MILVNLPVEIVSQIGTYLSQHALASTSLVCKAWRLAILPILYSSVIIGKNSHVKQFSTVLSSGSVDSVQISSCVKKLEIHLDDIDIDQSVLALLEPWVSRLTQLSEFRWNLYYVPDNLQLIQLFQTECPALSSVYISFPWERDFFKSESGQIQLSTLLGFKNIVNFELQTDDFEPGFEAECAQPLRALLLNCPGLQSLTLYFHDDDLNYSLDTLVAPWDHELTLPQLKKLHIRGAVELNLKTLFSPPGERPHALRDFLSRHPQIEDLELACCSVESYDEETNPHHFSLALPSLKYLKGPDLICDQLIRSTVASKLETLNIGQCSFEAGVDFLPDKVFGVQPLSKLRRLEIETDEFGDALEIMKLILPATEVLEELCITTVPYRYAQLRKLTMYNFSTFFMKATASVLPGGDEEASYEAELKRKLRILCPELETIN